MKEEVSVTRRKKSLDIFNQEFQFYRKVVVDCERRRLLVLFHFDCIKVELYFFSFLGLESELEFVAFSQDYVFFVNCILLDVLESFWAGRVKYFRFFIDFFRGVFLDLVYVLEEDAMKSDDFDLVIALVIVDFAVGADGVEFVGEGKLLHLLRILNHLIHQHHHVIRYLLTILLHLLRIGGVTITTKRQYMPLHFDAVHVSEESLRVVDYQW